MSFPRLLQAGCVPMSAHRLDHCRLGAGEIDEMTVSHSDAPCRRMVRLVQNRLINNKHLFIASSGSSCEQLTGGELPVSESHVPHPTGLEKDVPNFTTIYGLMRFHMALRNEVAAWLAASSEVQPHKPSGPGVLAIPNFDVRLVVQVASDGNAQRRTP